MNILWLTLKAQICFLNTDDSDDTDYITLKKTITETKGMQIAQIMQIFIL